MSVSVIQKHSQLGTMSIVPVKLKSIESGLLFLTCLSIATLLNLKLGSCLLGLDIDICVLTLNQPITSLP